MNQKKLNMRPVSSDYLEQYNALLRYVFQVTDQELSSVGWQEKEIIRAKFPTMEKPTCSDGLTEIPWSPRWRSTPCKCGFTGAPMPWED